MPDAAPAQRTPFPRSPDEFQNDNRVSFDKREQRWILEDHDGSEWEYSDALGKWMPSLDEELVMRQQAAYGAPGSQDDDGDAVAEHRKRKNAADDTAEKPKRQKSTQHPKPDRKNTAVYVTSLPLDATVDEISSVFSKCGVIAEELESGLPRIKWYLDDAGEPKGDALVIYFRPESVQLAIQMLDDTDFRFGVLGPMGKMRVKEADFSYKKQKEAPTQQNAKDKQKIVRKAQKMTSKLTDWDDDDPATVQQSSKHDKLVFLKHMFTLSELDEDPAAILDIKEDIREECSKLGQVTNVVLFDKEEAGVASVRFSTVEAALACVRVMDGRHFGGQTIEAHVSTGKERFKKSADKTYDDDESEEKARLDEFGSWLEKQE